MMRDYKYITFKFEKNRCKLIYRRSTKSSAFFNKLSTGLSMTYLIKYKAQELILLLVLAWFYYNFTFGEIWYQMPGCIVTTDTRFVRLHPCLSWKGDNHVDWHHWHKGCWEPGPEMYILAYGDVQWSLPSLVAIPVALLSQLAKPTPARRKTYISAPLIYAIGLGCGRAANQKPKLEPNIPCREYCRRSEIQKDEQSRKEMATSEGCAYVHAAQAKMDMIRPLTIRIAYERSFLSYVHNCSHIILRLHTSSLSFLSWFHKNGSYLG